MMADICSQMEINKNLKNKNPINGKENQMRNSDGNP